MTEELARMAEERLRMSEERLRSLEDRYGQSYDQRERFHNEGEADKLTQRLDAMERFLAGEGSYSGQVRDPQALARLRARYGMPDSGGGGGGYGGGQPDPNAPPAGPAEGATSDDGEWYTLSAKERKERSDELRGVQKAREGAVRGRKAIDAVPEDEYGAAAGGLGRKLGWLGRWGANDLDYVKQLLPGETGKNAESRISRRAMSQGQIDEIINDLNRAYNSTRATDRDRENIARALGTLDNENIYSTPQSTWHKILNLRDKVLQNDEKILIEENKTGRRRTKRPAPDLSVLSEGWEGLDDAPQQAPVAAPKAAAPTRVVRDSPEHYQLADQIQKANPGMTDQEAYEQALRGKDVGF